MEKKIDKNVPLQQRVSEIGKTEVQKKENKKRMSKAQKASQKPESKAKAVVTTKVNNAIRQELVPLISETVRSALNEPVGENGTPYYKAYVYNFLKDALEDPSGRCSQMLSSGIFNEMLFQKLDKEASAKTAFDAEYERYRILKTLYKEQREIYEDPNRYLFAICSRRVGKSTLATRLLVADAMFPNHRGLYVNVRYDQAIGQGYKMTCELLDSLGYVHVDKFSGNMHYVEYKTNKTEGQIELNNGSTIVFKGNSKAGEADKYQGYKYTFCVVDEVQSQPCLDYLLNQILGAAMVDVKGSKQLLIGTPPRIPNTYCEKLWKMKDNVYSKFHWSMEKNPYLENDVATEIEIACKKAGVTKDSAFIRREYFGEFVYDTEALIFKGYQTYKKIPEDFFPTKVWVGVDWGFVDHNAITVTAVDYYNKKAYVIDQQHFGRADSDEQERAVQKAYFKAIDFLRSYKVKDPDHVTTIVTDTNQPSITLKLQRMGLPVVNAYKPEVAPTIDALATEMRAGRLYIPEDGILVEECDRTVWKRTEDGNILPEVDDLTYHANALHALRYCSIYWLDEWASLAYSADNAIPLDERNGPLEREGYYGDSFGAPCETITFEELLN